MKQIFAWLFAAIFFAAGCAQSPDLAEPVRGGGYENADGLVIVAACPPATRTDIEEGKSTWEAGDRITVVYDGAAYEYTAAEAGPTTAFTSEAGIADYDASKPLTAYYPATTAEGVVAVEAERTIALDAESQSNPARAPLVGLPTSGNLAEGALEVTFRNIFSVIELRIDAGELASAAQSLTVEPADEAAFEGFLSFEGTVDPETLALTPAENGTGNSLVFNFAEGVDLTKPQTIKFPVGRFRSEAGLRLTLGTADGKSYSKNIYKTGITSYAEQGGVFRAKHMAKALYAFAPQGGISTADDLIEFAAAVNAGETLAPWQDDKGVVVLLDDIDLAEVTEWTPIGAATSKLANNALSITSGRPFTGYFDGQGHTIRNLKMVCKAAQATSAWGFFGAVADGAVVENLIFDASCSLEDKATAGTDCGVVAGLLTAPENPAVRYTYKCSGTATGSSYQHATVMQTMRFENAVTDGEVKIRCRAVGPYTCAGGTQNITATNAASSIPPYGFTGSYVQNFGTATPRDTKKVLCLGNSFSYYSNPAWMLKEIAWREGHALNIKAHFKGLQTLTQHLSLGFSTDVIEQGGYDFAFLQDQSQNPANYGRDATASILTGLTTLADKVRAASPSCKVILEETWTFSSASYGGFTDFPTFETYNDAGAKAMAKAAGTWVSPIGPAFRQVREGGSGINLYYSDSKHQSEYGAYLKACVNYLVLFGERFGADPADCGLNPDKAAYLRSVAEQIVLGNEGDYFIER